MSETISKLSAFKFIKPAIVVGIDNTSNRFGNYMPTKPFETGADHNETAWRDRLHIALRFLLSEH